MRKASIVIAFFTAVLVCAGPAAAQDVLEPLVEDRPIQLLSNLFTRIGAAVTVDGHGPFTSSSLARAGRAMGSTNSAFTCEERAW